MKHLKKYENSNNQTPKVGDFVICDDGDEIVSNKYQERKVNEFLRTNVGEIVSINPNLYFDYMVKYDIDWSRCGFEQSFFQLNEDPIGHRMMRNEDIIYWSKNKGDCEQYLMTNKYNI